MLDLPLPLLFSSQALQARYLWKLPIESSCCFVVNASHLRLSHTELCVYNAFLPGVSIAPLNHHHRVYLHSQGIVYAASMHYPTPKLS